MEAEGGTALAQKWVDAVEAAGVQARDNFYQELLAAHSANIDTQAFEKMKTKAEGAVGQLQGSFLDYLKASVMHQDVGLPSVFESHHEAMLDHTLTALCSQLDAELAYSRQLQAGAQQRAAAERQLTEAAAAMKDAALLTRASVADMGQSVRYLAESTDRAVDSANALLAARNEGPPQGQNM